MENSKFVDNYCVTSKILGQGSFGQVFRGYQKDDHTKIVAVKVIPINKIKQNATTMKLLKRELEIL